MRFFHSSFLTCHKETAPLPSRESHMWRAYITKSGVLRSHQEHVTCSPLSDRDELQQVICSHRKLKKSIADQKWLNGMTYLELLSNAYRKRFLGSSDSHYMFEPSDWFMTDSPSFDGVWPGFLHCPLIEFLVTDLHIIISSGPHSKRSWRSSRNENYYIIREASPSQWGRSLR